MCRFKVLPASEGRACTTIWALLTTASQASQRSTEIIDKNVFNAPFIDLIDRFP
jgi:hypothetical protein